MKRLVCLVALTAAAVPVFAADVSGSININQPGVYGRIDIGNFPPPQLIYPQPVLIQRVPVAPQPVYLHVPPGHAKNWRKHCARYNACGQPVYFVQENWYQDVYAPRYREGREHRGNDEHRGDDDRRGQKEKHGGGRGKGNKHDQ